MNLVTGGTGFIGAHVVRALLARGRKVRCLVRSESRRSNLEGLNVEIAVGDVTDPASLAPAMQGVATVYHCAADYRLSVPDPRPLFECNVAGTENVMRAASEAGVSRVVHTSSVGALGRTADGTPATEETPVAPASLIGPYKRSKYEAERVAQHWAKRGLPVVIVNPSTPVGEFDVKPTPTGKMIVDFLNRRMPAYVDTGLNIVDVRDVALRTRVLLKESEIRGLLAHTLSLSSDDADLPASTVLIDQMVAEERRIYERAMEREQRLYDLEATAKELRAAAADLARAAESLREGRVERR